MKIASFILFFHFFYVLRIFLSPTGLLNEVSDLQNLPISLFEPLTRSGRGERESLSVDVYKCSVASISRIRSSQIERNDHHPLCSRFSDLIDYISTSFD
jgi:hypothetical protein